MAKVKIKDGCNLKTVAATLQGLTVTCKMDQLTQPQLRELYERFKHPYVILEAPEEHENEPKNTPARRKAPRKPSEPSDEAGE